MVYDGVINHNVIRAFTDLTNNELGVKNEANPVKRKVFNVMVECLQNINKHAEHLDNKDTRQGRGILLISESKNTYNVTTGNVIKSLTREKISKSIEIINSKDKDGLRELYKERLSNGRMSKKGGAGLGFIDIARKSGNKLEYHFEKINDDYYFFILNSQISKTV